MMTAELQNAKMAQERTFITQFFEAALQGKTKTVQSSVLEYCKNHNQQQPQNPITPIQVLTQFKDASRRTVLHFACQSEPGRQTFATYNKSKTRLDTDMDMEETDDMLETEECAEDIVVALLTQKMFKLPSGPLEAFLRLKDKDGLTPLMLAAQNIPSHTTKHPSNKTHPEHDNEEEKESLRYHRHASRIAYARIQAILRTGGAKVALARSHSGGTALHYAASKGASSSILQMIYQSAPIAIRTRSLKGGTPLHWAAGVPPPANYVHTIQALLDSCHADIHASDREDVPVSTIFHDGNNNNKKEEQEEKNALHQQSMQQQQQQPQGLSPLILAAAAGNDAHAKYLVQRGADRSVLVTGNHTVFHIAADLNLVGTLAALLDTSSSTFETETSTTSSSLATVTTATRLHEIITTCLTLQTLDQGFTPLDLAVYEGHLACVMLLLDEPNEDKAKLFMEKRKQVLVSKNSSIRTTPTKVSDQHHDPDTSNLNHTSSSSDNNMESKYKESEIQSHVHTLKTSSNITEEEKRQAHEYKVQGNTHFANREYTKAVEWYTKAISFNPLDETFYSNRSACYMALHNYSEGLYDALMTKTLKPEWAKGCYRVAVARLALEQYEEAAVIAWEGLRLEPENSELKSLLQRCVKKGRKGHLENASGTNKAEAL